MGNQYYWVGENNKVHLYRFYSGEGGKLYRAENGKSSASLSSV